MMFSFLQRLDDFSLKIKIIFASFAAAVIGLSIIVFLVGNQNFNYAKETTTKYAQATLKTYARSIESQINLGFDSSLNLALLAQENLNNLSFLQKFLQDIIQKNPYYKSAFVWLGNNQTLIASQDNENLQFKANEIFTHFLQILKAPFCLSPNKPQNPKIAPIKHQFMHPFISSHPLVTTIKF